MLTKLEREKMTVQIMLRIYCKDHHLANGLCSECQVLLDYATERLSHCKFGDRKLTCGKCIVHCYKPEMRKRIKEIMHYSGPKMLIRHPLIAIKHLFDGMKKGGS